MDMNHFFRKKAIVAVCFVLFIGISFFVNVGNLSLDLDLKKGVTSVISQVETSINEQVVGKYGLVDFFGYLQRVMGKEEVNDFEVVQDEQGFLHYTYFGDGAKDMSDLVKKLSKFRSQIKNKEIEFLYIMTPDKYIPGYTTFSTGVPYSYANETADNFIAELKKRKLDSIDLRDFLSESGIENSKLFYKTDHHWTIETSFWAFCTILEQMKEKFDFEPEHLLEVTNLDNYNQITYENSFVGSMGRKNGILYSGIDDFTLIYPKFETNYIYRATTKANTIELTGRFEQALLTMTPFTYTGSQYDVEADKYSSYLYGNQGVAHIQNTEVDGPKIAIVKDSFMIPVAAFLSTVCSDVYLLDIRYYDESIVDYVNEIEDLDYVFVSYTPQDLVEDFFLFN